MNNSQNNELANQKFPEAEKHERVIDEKLGGYVEVGLALAEIQDKKLHPGKFIDYASDRFGMKRHIIYRLIRSAMVAKTLIEAGLPRPRNIGQAHRIHELASDDPQEQIELWRIITRSGVPPTISEIDRVAESLIPDIFTPNGDEENVGQIDMGSAHQIDPSQIQKTNFEPLKRLRTLAEEIQAVHKEIQYDALDLDDVRAEVHRLQDLLANFQQKLDTQVIAA